MNPLEGVRLELTKLLGKKELTFGCEVIIYGEKETIIGKGHDWEGESVNTFIYTDIGTNKIIEIIGHPATLSDLHRWMNEKFRNGWEQISEVKADAKSIHNRDRIIIHLKGSSTVYMDGSHFVHIPYDSSLPLLDQDEETLKQIRDLILSNQ